jgi:ketosteroid isomerase-like protein
VTSWDPAAHEPGSAAHEPGSAAQEPAAPDRAARDDTGGRRIVRRRGPARAAAAAAAAVLGLVGLGLLAGAIFGDGGVAPRTGPLTEAEVRSAAEAFGEAYAAEDRAALRQTLARDVVRMLPGGASRGRDQVVDQYTRQFDGRVGGYDLQDLQVSGGRAGRASGTYHVDRQGGDPYEGRIVFGVVRERGEPRIALIAATPTN